MREERRSLFARPVFERREGELVWPEDSVTGTAVTYGMVRVTIR